MPIFETARLILRPWKEKEAEALYKSDNASRILKTTDYGETTKTSKDNRTADAHCPVSVCRQY